MAVVAKPDHQSLAILAPSRHYSARIETKMRPHRVRREIPPTLDPDPCPVCVDARKFLHQPMSHASPPRIVNNGELSDSDLISGEPEQRISEKSSFDRFGYDNAGAFSVVSNSTTRHKTKVRSMLVSEPFNIRNIRNQLASVSGKSKIHRGLPRRVIVVCRDAAPALLVVPNRLFHRVKVLSAAQFVLVFVKCRPI